VEAAVEGDVDQAAQNHNLLAHSSLACAAESMAVLV